MRQTTKLASRRPLAVQYPLKRASPRLQANHVLRQLALQEGGGIGAVRTQQRPIGQTHDAVECDGLCKVCRP